MDSKLQMLINLTSLVYQLQNWSRYDWFLSISGHVECVDVHYSKRDQSEQTAIVDTWITFLTCYNDPTEMHALIMKLEIYLAECISGEEE